MSVALELIVDRYVRSNDRGVLVATGAHAAASAHLF
jgi:hypothetical protein